MKVDPSLTRVGAQAGTQRVARQQTENTTSHTVAVPSPTRPSDEMVLSERAQEVLLARRALADLPDVRDDKVAALQQKLANGTFRVDPEKIVDGLLRGELR